jgi:UDP-N-acetylenolpyruvoylglucosamine reductase
MATVQARVLAAHGILLEPEVEIWGPGKLITG